MPRSPSPLTARGPDISHKDSSTLARGMDWTSQEVLDFLHFYENEPAIWNPRDPVYKNRQNVNEAWRRIADAMDNKFSVSELKAKKLSLMATYRKLATRVRTSQEETWKPDWFAYDAMDRFLNVIYEPRPGKQVKQEAQSGAEDDETPIDDPSGEDQNYEEADHIFEREYRSEMPRTQRMPFIDNYLEVTVDEPPVKQPKETYPKRPREQHSNNSLHSTFCFMKSIFEKPEPDECSLFGEFITKKLRAMDEGTREYAMLEMHNLLYRIKVQQRPGAELDEGVNSVDSGTASTS